MTTTTPGAEKAPKKNQVSEPKDVSAKAAAAKPSLESQGFTKKISTQVEYFYRPELKDGTLQSVQGVILATRERPLTPRDEKEGKTSGGIYHILRLTAPCVGVDEDKVEHELEPGQTIWVDERSDTVDWRDYHPRRLQVGIGKLLPAGMPAMTEVCWEPKRKKDIGGGRKLWIAESYFKHYYGAEIMKLGLQGLIPEKGMALISSATNVKQLPMPEPEIQSEGEADIPF